MNYSEDMQGIRTGPLVGSLVLLLLSCILIQLSLNSDWASMSAEVEYTAEEREVAELWGFDLPEISMAVSFGLTDMTTMASNDGEETEETITLEEYVEENAHRERQFLDMDWDEWHSTGKSTSIALWIGFIAAILGFLMVIIGAFKANDTAHGGGIILCGLAAALINAGWFNWIIFGGNFAEFVDIGGDGFKSNGFGVTTGFSCMVSRFAHQQIIASKWRFFRVRNATIPTINPPECYNCNHACWFTCPFWSGTRCCLGIFLLR